MKIIFGYFGIRGNNIGSFGQRLIKNGCRGKSFGRFSGFMPLTAVWAAILITDCFKKFDWEKDFFGRFCSRILRTGPNCSARFRKCRVMRGAGVPPKRTAVQSFSQKIILFRHVIAFGQDFPAVFFFEQGVFHGFDNGGELVVKTLHQFLSPFCCVFIGFFGIFFPNFLNSGSHFFPVGKVLFRFDRCGAAVFFDFRYFQAVFGSIVSEGRRLVGKKFAAVFFNGNAFQKGFRMAEICGGKVA